MLLSCFFAGDLFAKDPTVGRETVLLRGDRHRDGRRIEFFDLVAIITSESEAARVIVPQNWVCCASDL